MLILQLNDDEGVVIGDQGARLFVDRIHSPGRATLSYETEFMTSKLDVVTGVRSQVAPGISVMITAQRKEAEHTSAVSLGFDAPRSVKITRLDKFEEWGGHRQKPIID